MKKLLKKRTGFTLVELLIVIIIIGILAGAMLLVAGSGTDKAEATKIVSNLRSLKAAALMYYADYPNTTELNAVANKIDLLKKYMDKTLDSAQYTFTAGSVSGDAVGGWFVGRLAITSPGVKEKLIPMAEETALLGKAEIGGDSVVSTDLYKGGEEVYMRAR